MTTASRPVPAHLTGLLLPTLLAGLVAAGCAAGMRGMPGLLGASVGAGLVVAFFTSSHLVLGWAVWRAPDFIVPVALGLYTAKVVALALLLASVSDFDSSGDSVHRAALGLSVVACTLVWTVAEVRAAVTTRIPTYDLGGKSA